MSDPTNVTVFVVVIALRLFIPLLIPRFPLPAVIACLIIDGIDQTVFQNLTDLDLTNYQSYDKGLDIYYLTIAYLATLRNWTNITAIEVSRFLLYYRLIGVVLFEHFQKRYMLLLFPNTFEYFFIFYEAVRLRWNPIRLSRALVFGAAAAIWIVIKLPQEYWLHVAQRDVTDTLRADPWLIPLLGIAILAVVVGAWWAVTKKCPPADHPLQIEAVTEGTSELAARVQRTLEGWKRVINPAIVEKVVLLSLVSIIFSQILPGIDASVIQITIGVFLIVASNALVSEILRRRGIVKWEGGLAHFGGVATLNAALALSFWVILPTGDGDLNLGRALFFLFLISVMVTLYDRFHPVYEGRRDEAGLRLGSSF